MHNPEYNKYSVDFYAMLTLLNGRKSQPVFGHKKATQTILYTPGYL